MNLVKIEVSATFLWVSVVGLPKDPIVSRTNPLLNVLTSGGDLAYWIIRRAVRREV